MFGRTGSAKRFGGAIMFNCWGYRINTKCKEFFDMELSNGRLRQGWGYELSQNLLKASAKDDVYGNARNLRMLDVRKGDILLIPGLPGDDYVTFVRATDDWQSGYRFEISAQEGDLGCPDFGHIFPAMRIMQALRAELPEVIRSTLRVEQRFWQANADATREIGALLDTYLL